MGNKMKKLICALLASAMLVSSVGMVAFADEVTTAATETTETAETTEEAEVTETAEEAEETEAPEATQAPVTTGTGTAYDNDAYYQKALSLCSALGIISGYEDGSVKPESKVTRAEMASIVLRMLNTKSMSAYQNGFTDVTSAHWAADQIQTAQEASIINGMGDGTFAPDGEVTYAQVMVMLVNALNYKQDATYYGGWQTGYVKVAGELNLLKNAPGNNDVASERGVVIKMVYNALLADYKEISKYENGTPVYESKETLSEAKFDLIEEEGVLMGTSKTSVSGSKIQDGHISILPDDATKTVLYACDLAGLDEYLAQVITYYYMENSGLTPEILAVTYDSSKSDVVSIDVDDVETLAGFNNDAGEVKVDGVAKKKNCAGATIIYNGKVVTAAQKAENDMDELLLPEVGSLKLVDSDKDDVYDIVFVDSYETIIISSTSTDRLTGKVSDATEADIAATKAITLDLDDSEDRVITVEREGIEVKLRNLKKNDVASVKRSLDNTVVDIVVTGKNITGKASGVSRRLDASRVTINGEKYDVANIAVDDIKTGVEAIFYFDQFDRIAYIESASADGMLQSGEKYGWIMDSYESEDGNDYIIYMMTTDGKAVEMKTGSNLDYWAPTATSAEKLSGTSTISNTISKLLSANSFIKESNASTPIRLVKYKVNSSNVLSRLYCAVDSTVVSDKDALRIDKTNLTGKPVISGLVGGYNIGDGILEISVPKNVTDMKNTDNYSFGEVTASTYAVRENGSSRSFVVGEFLDSGAPTLLINLTVSSDALANLGDIDTNANNPVMVVEEVNVGIDEDDNEVYVVSGYVNGAEASFTTTKNTVLGKISTSSAIINSARDYLTTTMWDAHNGAASAYSGMKFTDMIEEGDLVLYDTGERLIQLLDADDVYDVVQNGKSKSGLLFGGFNPFTARNMFAFGALNEAKLDDTAIIELDIDSSLSTIQFDSSRLMDTIEINIKSGKATIDTDGSTISDLETFDTETKTGDYVYARFADKGTLQEVVVYRFTK